MYWVMKQLLLGCQQLKLFSISIGDESGSCCWTTFHNSSPVGLGVVIGLGISNFLTWKVLFALLIQNNRLQKFGEPFEEKSKTPPKHVKAGITTFRFWNKSLKKKQHNFPVMIIAQQFLLMICGFFLIRHFSTVIKTVTTLQHRLS